MSQQSRALFRIVPEHAVSSAGRDVVTFSAVATFIILPALVLGLLVCAAVFYSQVQAHRRLDRELDSKDR